MKITPFLAITLSLFVLCINSPVTADNGAGLAKVRLLLKDGSHKAGYFYLAELISLGRDDSGYYYYSGEGRKSLMASGDAVKGFAIDEADHHFHRYFQNLLQDTIRLFQVGEVVRVAPDSQSAPVAIAALMGVPDAIAAVAIQRVIVERIFITGFGYIKTKLLVDDASWLRQNLRSTVNVGGFEMCTFQVVAFAPSSKKVDVWVDELRAILKEASAGDEPVEYDHVEAKINAIAAKLRTEKCLLISWCSS